jgi:hypothetical protein
MYGLLYECKFLTIEETNKKKKKKKETGGKPNKMSNTGPTKTPEMNRIR